MEEKAILLTPGFSVADAEYPDITLKDGKLVVKFIDAREIRIRVVFINAAGLKWQEIDTNDGPAHRNDRVYEIQHSKWHAEYLKQGARSPQDDLHHYKLCFNAYGPLEILASSFTFTEVD